MRKLVSLVFRTMPLMKCVELEHEDPKMLRKDATSVNN
jgi:hypothetical protein